jgi:CheY-like chemotaxis protein
MLGKNILLVDDEKVIRTTYALLLGEHGYSVITADCKKNALAAFTSHSFDLVITDLVMSGGDGFRLIEEIKETSPKTPVIAFTGKLSTSVDKYVSLVGADEVIEKSCTNALFISCVRHSLEAGA